MDVTVSLDLRYAVTPDGSGWSQAPMTQQFWGRYLEVFDRVRIIARATRVEQPPEGWLPVTDGNVILEALPDYCGPSQYLMRYPGFRAATRAALPARGAVIMRVGSQIANVLEASLSRQHRPYALEVVGDPYEVFARGVLDHPLRPFFRWYFSRRLRRQCVGAIGVAYVTKETLQKRYPCRSMSVSISDVHLPEDAVLSTHYSSIELLSTQMATSIRPAKRSGPYRIVTVGSLAQLYKGTDILLESLARCHRNGLDLTAVVVGDGKYRMELQNHAARLGLERRVEFTGEVTSGEPVRRILDTADLFVLPSRTEGLPRALIEAMARGLPCIASAVGGIPELLSMDNLVPPNDPDALAGRIRDVLSDPSRMEAMSARNIQIAHEYSEAILRQRRLNFYRYVRDRTAKFESEARS